MIQRLWVLALSETNFSWKVFRIFQNTLILLSRLAYATWVPNLFESKSHCPIDDSEMSQRAIAHRTYTLFIAVKFEGLPGSLVFDTEILNSESGERLSSPPLGETF